MTKTPILPSITGALTIGFSVGRGSENLHFGTAAFLFSAMVFMLLSGIFTELRKR